MSIEKYFATIIEREGGFVDNPSDKGGATKYGVTLNTLSEYMGKECTVDDIKNLPVDTAYKIFKDRYFIKSGIVNIRDYNLQAIMLDTAVNSGEGRAVKLLQQALGIKDDGIIGAVTIQFANAAMIEPLRKKYMSLRIRFLGRIIEKDHTQATFAAGWLNRCGDLLETLV